MRVWLSLSKFSNIDAYENLIREKAIHFNTEVSIERVSDGWLRTRLYITIPDDAHKFAQAYNNWARSGYE